MTIQIGTNHGTIRCLYPFVPVVMFFASLDLCTLPSTGSLGYAYSHTPYLGLVRSTS
jgi:hypothetical protein